LGVAFRFFKKWIDDLPFRLRQGQWGFENMPDFDGKRVQGKRLANHFNPRVKHANMDDGISCIACRE